MKLIRESMLLVDSPRARMAQPAPTREPERILAPGSQAYLEGAICVGERLRDSEALAGFSHGSTGIALGRMLMLPHMDGERARREIVIAMEETRANGFGGNQSLCHGDLGNADVMFTVGETLLKLRAGRDLYLTSQVEEQLPLLVFTSKTFLPLIWQFDPETLLPLYGIAANPKSSRLQYAAILPSELGSAEDVPALEGLLEYPDHFVRWSAVKNIMALDEDRGMRALRAAVSDPHPHVSRAAKRSPERILASEDLDRGNISTRQESPFQAQS